MNGDFDLYVLNGKIKELNEKIENLKKENIFLPKQTAMTEEKAITPTSQQGAVIEYEFEFPVKFNYVKIRKNENSTTTGSTHGKIYFMYGENSITFDVRYHIGSNSIYILMVNDFYYAGANYLPTINEIYLEAYYSTIHANLAPVMMDVYFTKLRLEIPYENNMRYPFYISVCYTEG